FNSSNSFTDIDDIQTNGFNLLVVANQTVSFSTVGDILGGGEIIGDIGDETITGNDDANIIRGGDGSDVLNGEAGNDTLYAGTEFSTVISDILAANSGVSYNAVTGNFYQYVVATVTPTAATTAAASTLLSGVGGHLVTITSAQENSFAEALITGGDAWIGASDATTEGNWQWIAGPENGIQFSNVGTSVNGLYENWNGSEPVTSPANRDYVDLSPGGAWEAERDTDTSSYIVEWEGDAVLATVGDGGATNTLNGGTGNDIFYGSNGTDIMNGGDGADDFYVYGGSGLGDTFNGGNNGDEIFLQSDVIFNLVTTFTSIEDIESGGFTIYAEEGTGFDLTGMTITGGSTLRGQGLAETLTGSNSADYIRGGDGNDTINGGAGDDQLYGEGGADIFDFDIVGTQNDIHDFSVADGDQIDISDLLTGYTSGVDDITLFVRITDNAGNSDLRVDPTGSGTFGGGTRVALIQGVTGLTDELALETAGTLIT
ncbi:MAG: type I secretion C-terminal target domain-containing protein, partial [Pseudomonadota bacterium]